MLQRWEPFGEFRRMEEAMDRVWRGYGWRALTGNGHVRSWGVPLDVVEDGDSILVHASLPGVDPEKIEVTIENDLLTIKGHTGAGRESGDGGYLVRERRSGAFHRTLRLPDTVDIERASPSYENGVLTVAFPKAESKKARQLKVRVGKALSGSK